MPLENGSRIRKSILTYSNTIVVHSGYKLGQDSKVKRCVHVNRET